jgi:hypothetical protein
VQVWVDRYDESALHDADAFVTAHLDDVDAERAGHDLAVYLCNWIVVNSEAAQWVLDPAGTCHVELGDNTLDPYRSAVTCVAERQPIASRFVEQARTLGA